MSQKSIHDEDYPIGSPFLRSENRKIIHTFYKFARCLDDIADDPKLVALDKEARIAGFENALMGKENDPLYETGINMFRMLQEQQISPKHPKFLIQAFLMDTRKDRYSTWRELQDYSLLSTAPVGRFYLDLHGESPLLWSFSDSICVAIQVLNNIRDAGQDYINLNRVYLPSDWMEEANAVEAMLGEKHTSGALKIVFDRVLDKVDGLLEDGEKLLAEIYDTRLALEVSLLHTLIKKLSSNVRAGDVLNQKITLSKKERILTGLEGFWTFLKNRTI